MSAEFWAVYGPWLRCLFCLAAPVLLYFTYLFLWVQVPYLMRVAVESDYPWTFLEGVFSLVGEVVLFLVYLPSSSENEPASMLILPPEHQSLPSVDNRKLVAPKLQELTRKWNQDREELRKHEWLWPLKREWSEYKLYTQAMEMLEAKEEIEKQTFLDRLAVVSQELVKHDQTQLEIKRATIEFYQALAEFEGVIEAAGGSNVDEDLFGEWVAAIVDAHLKRLVTTLVNGRVHVNTAMEEEIRYYLLNTARAKLLGTGGE